MDWTSTVGNDIWYSARLLRRQPRYALVVVLTMALGIGATTALFSVTYGVLVKPLPWEDADELVVLTETRGGNRPRFGSFSNAAFLAWREQASTIDDLAAWSQRTVTVRRNGGTRARSHRRCLRQPVSHPGCASVDRVALR
jgi:putative ABC transport system permease protein